MACSRNRKQVALLACGCFNPPTYMHLRMFERARDYVQKVLNADVLEGIFSPCSDAFPKSELVAAKIRLQMLSVALITSDWIRTDDWECGQKQWSRTVTVLRHLRDQLSKKYKNFDDNKSPIQLMLLCGGDLVTSFTRVLPNGTRLWAIKDLEEIARDFGLVVVSRSGFDPAKTVYELDFLRKYEHNIHIISDETFPNDISSTKLRMALRRGESIKYCTPDAVIDLIRERNLYTEPIEMDSSTSNKSNVQHNNQDSPDFGSIFGIRNQSQIDNENNFNTVTPCRSEIIKKDEKSPLIFETIFNGRQGNLKDSSDRNYISENISVNDQYTNGEAIEQCQQSANDVSLLEDSDTETIYDNVPRRNNRNERADIFCHPVVPDENEKVPIQEQIAGLQIQTTGCKTADNEIGMSKNIDFDNKIIISEKSQQNFAVSKSNSLGIYGNKEINGKERGRNSKSYKSAVRSQSEDEFRRHTNAFRKSNNNKKSIFTNYNQPKKKKKPENLTKLHLEIVENLEEIDENRTSVPSNVNVNTFLNNKNRCNRLIQARSLENIANLHVGINPQVQGDWKSNVTLKFTGFKLSPTPESAV